MAIFPLPRVHNNEEYGKDSPKEIQAAVHDIESVAACAFLLFFIIVALSQAVLFTLATSMRFR